MNDIDQILANSGLEITAIPSEDAEPEEPEEELYEELSALEQAMESEEHQIEGNLLTGGAKREEAALDDEKPLDPVKVLTPPKVKDKEELWKYLKSNLYRFESPYSYIGGGANSPNANRAKDAEVRVLIARISTYEATALSMSHSMLVQIFEELPKVYCDITFMPKPTDYNLLVENGFPLWFGINSKMAPSGFDVLGIVNAVSTEQLNMIPMLWNSGIPLWKQQRMEREDVPIIVLGGANSGTVAGLSGTWTDHEGKEWSGLVDCVIYGDGEIAAKKFVEVVREGKKKGWTKREILRECHGKVPGFYEHDCYVHEYDLENPGRLKEIRQAEGKDYAEFPVRRSTVVNLDEVKTLENKILPMSGDTASVDVAIAGNVGCIGSGGWGACSFCREGSEGPYRERSLSKVMEAIENATRNQGTKEVSFFSLNFNQYTEFFPLVAESVKKGYKVGLISQRVDMLAETPEQIRVQRWLKKSNYTLGIEGISGRMRAYLNKNLQEWEILAVCAEMMKNGAGELKFFMIATGLETEVDNQEWCAMMEKINAIREKLGATTRFRVSFTPLFPMAYTALQFAPCLAAIDHGAKNLDTVFNRAKELGWGRRLSVVGEEPLVSNTLNHAGRALTPLLVDAYFRDNFRFYGIVPRGTWARWTQRMKRDYPHVIPEVFWGQKDINYVFPWEDIAYSTSKEALFRGYLKAMAFQGLAYCLTTRSVKGVCHVNECGACDPLKTGKPDPKLIKSIVGRKVAPTIPVAEMEKLARAREKFFHIRMLVRLDDPTWRYVQKGYFNYAIPRAFMRTNEVFNDAFVQPLGHARIACGTNMQKDWTYGYNIYDFSVCEHIPESELKAMLPEVNAELEPETTVLDVQIDNHRPMLRNDIDNAVYSVFVPAEGSLNFRTLRSDITKYFEKRALGKDVTIRVKRPSEGKGVFIIEHLELDEADVRAVTFQWMPEHRGTLVRMVCSSLYNPLSMLEAITGRRMAVWKRHPIWCDGYIQMPQDTKEVDVFAALAGNASFCTVCGGPLDVDLFKGEKMESGKCCACALEENYPVPIELFNVQEAPTFVKITEAA